ncbi:MAG: tetratricopeptide repeat protein [Bacteroidia bacterium]
MENCIFFYATFAPHFEKKPVKILRFYIIYRLPIIILLIVGGIASHIWFDTVLAWLCYIAALISLLLYFMMGTMRIVQEAVQAGEVEQARDYLKMIRFPKLLFKPIRMGYYMLQSNLDLATDDLVSAEANIRQSLKTNSTLAGDVRGANLMQLGFVELRKGNTKEARKHLQEALKAGIPDKDSLAATHLQLCSMEIQRQQYRIAKEHFKKAKAAKPKNDEILNQIKMFEKQIPRLPG